MLSGLNSAMYIFSELQLAGLEINLIGHCVLRTKFLGNRNKSWFANSETKIISDKGLLVRLNIWLTLL